MQNIEAEATLLKQRIAVCRSRIQQAAGDAKKTAEFEKHSIQFYTAAGHGESDAIAKAAAVRGYVEALPGLLERLLESAREPDVPDAWVTKKMALLRAALDAFENSSAVPDEFGLAGLLDNAYLASRLLPEEFQVNLNHEPEIQILGPFTILQLDQRVKEIRATLAQGVKAGDSLAPNAPAPVSAAVRGDCTDCAHMRYGTPVVQAVFDNLLAAVRDSARQAFTRNLREEREMSRQFYDERETLKRSEDTNYTRRPTERRLTYCGVEEFEGVYQCCEVKNLDKQCTQFHAKSSPPRTRACANCRHHYQVPFSVFHTMQKVAQRGQRGLAAWEKIKQTLERKAESEFEECLQYDGVLHSARPGTLPHCESRSSSEANGEIRFVVGPVVNVAKECDRWEAGENENLKRFAAEFATVNAAAERAWQKFNQLPTQALMDVAANADADIIEVGLSGFGFQPSAVEEFGVDYFGATGSQSSDSVRTSRASRPTDDPGAAQSHNATGGSGDAFAGALRVAGSLFGQSSSDGLRSIGSFLANVSQEMGNPGEATLPRVSEGQTSTTGDSGDAFAGALRMAGALFSLSSSDGLRSIGSFLANVSREMDKPAEPTPLRDVSASRALANEPASTGPDAGHDRKRAQFIVEPGKSYRHPEDPNVIVEYHLDRGTIGVRDRYNTPCLIRVSSFPADSWQVLSGPNGELPAAVCVSGSADGAARVYAQWL